MRSGSTHMNAEQSVDDPRLDTSSSVCLLLVRQSCVQSSVPTPDDSLVI